MNTPHIVIGSFCMSTFFKKEREGNPAPEQVLRMVKDNFKYAKQGYREGVLLVPLPVGFENPCCEINMDGTKASRWRCPIVELKEGDYLFGRFEARVQGEEPRKKINVLGGTTMEVKSVDAVLYHRDVLRETEDRAITCDYEVVTILTKPCEGEQPMPPDTLMANHFGASGGTPTNMTPEQFEAALRESFAFWRNKAMIY